MKFLQEGQYACLRTGRRLVVATARCPRCGAFDFIPGDLRLTARHNLDVAYAGERVYMGAVVNAPQGRAA